MRNLFEKPYSIFLETSKQDSKNQETLLFQEPQNIIEAKSLSEVNTALERIEVAHQRGKWLAGYMSYEAGLAFEKKLQRLPVSSSLPLVWFGEYDAPILNPSIQFDHKQNVAEHVAFNVSKEDYAKKIVSILAYIQAGDVYQVNFTGKLSFEFQGNSVELYETLREKQSVAYAAFLNLGEQVVLSFSPELFFRVKDGIIESKPMKGTAPRGRTTAEDEAFASWLKTDEKNRAENLMILDLIRNDFGRICKTGSITVPSLFEIERFQTLFQMTSTVRGELKDDIIFKEIFEAIFPCGSITGAPKIRAMEIISELEAQPRGVYTGAIGFISPKKEACFSVAIRTVVVENQHVKPLVGEMGIGSGITIDSESQTEYDECLLKANFLTKPAEEFALIESIKLYGHYCFLEKHLARLKDSATYFGFKFDEDALRTALAQYAKRLDEKTPYKVRLVLAKSGQVKLSHEQIEPTRGIGKVAIAGARTNSADKFFYHKTTKRQIYDEASKLAHQLGLADFIFLNERGEVAEGAISNVFIEKAGRLYTPPIASGILAGVYRAYVLETHRYASERVVQFDELREAERIWICNAVRGMREVKLVSV
ncbi:MAG: aminodeoxychorismate synthase component I [Chlorobiales bacterium]